DDVRCWVSVGQENPGAAVAGSRVPALAAGAGAARHHDIAARASVVTPALAGGSGIGSAETAVSSAAVGQMSEVLGAMAGADRDRDDRKRQDRCDVTAH